MIKPIPTLTHQFTPSIETIGLVRRPGADYEESMLLWALADSTVSDSLSPHPRRSQPLAKTVGRDPNGAKTYLVEALPWKFVEETTTFPLRWDPIVVSGIIYDEVWESGETYHVTGNIWVLGTLAIEPSITVKLNPSCCIVAILCMGYSGAVVARGGPWEFITFTSASDANCGEEIPNAPAGMPDQLVNLSSGSSQESVIQYCKFTKSYGHGGMLRLIPDLYEPIANNVFCLPGRGSNYDDCCVFVQGSSFDDLVLSNNLFVCNQKSNDSAIYYDSNWTTGESTCHNNTFVGFYDAIYAAECGPNTSIAIFDNLFSESTYAVDAPHSTISNNAFHLTPPCGEPYIDLGEKSPFATCKLGDYYLDQDNAPELFNAGSQTAADAGFTPDIFAVEAPPEKGGGLSSLNITRMTLYQTGDEIVTIGYHAPRVDYIISGSVGMGSGGGEIAPGCVVAFTQGDNVWVFVFGTRLICKGLGAAGDPVESRNRLLDSRCAVTISGGKTMSPWYRGDTSGVTFYCNQGYDIQFTEFAWLGSGVFLANHQEAGPPSVVRGNIFKFSWAGMLFARTDPQHLEPGNPYMASYRARNCIFYKNFRGMYAAPFEPQCEDPPVVIADFSTFDENQQGMYADEWGHARARCCLFSKNGQIIQQEIPGCAFIVDTPSTDDQNEEDFNGFFGNSRDTRYTDDPEDSESLRGRHSIVLSVSPYDRLSNERSLWFLDQKAGNQALDATDEGTGTSNLLDVFGTAFASTGRHAFRERAGIDVGYHVTDILDSDGDGMPDPWEEHFQLDPDSADSDLDPDYDTYTNLTEYSERTPNGPAVGDFERGPYLQDISHSEVTVFWATRETFTDHRIEYHREGETPWSHTIPVNDGVQYGRDGQIYEVQEVRITELESGKKYLYRVKSKNGGSDVVGAAHSFWTLACTDWDWPFRIVFQGDHEGSGDVYQKGHRRVVHSILSAYFSAYERALLLLFDGGDYTELGNDEAQWNYHYFAPAWDLLHQIPVSGVPGEKEYGQIDCYRNYFAPAPEAPSPIRWSREYFYDAAGNSCLYVLFIDTEDLDPDDQEAIEEELSSVCQRDPKPWIVVIAHIPCVTHTSAHSIWDDDIKSVRAALGKIFFDNGVDIALCSHSHVYERYRYRSIGDEFDILYESNFHDISFPTYVVSGGGGAALGDLLHLSPYPPPLGNGVGHYARDFPPKNHIIPGDGNSLGETLHHCLIEFLSQNEARLTVLEVTGLCMGENEETRDKTVVPEKSILIQKRLSP